MPIVRATITIQVSYVFIYVYMFEGLPLLCLSKDPKSNLPNVREALYYLYTTRGVKGLWHGVSAGILKTVPKYITAVVVRDWCEEKLPPADINDRTAQTYRFQS
jgi:hypothetical protein